MMKKQVNAKSLRVGLFLALVCVAGACAVSAGEAKAAAQTKTASQPKAAAQTKPAQKKAAGDTAINVQQLAVVDRALEFCAPIDPDSSKKLKEQAAELTKGSSAEAVAQARGSDTYKTAYSSMDGFIGQIDPRNAKVACANTAGSNKTARGKSK